MFSVVNDITDRCPSGDQKNTKDRMTANINYYYVKRSYDKADTL